MLSVFSSRAAKIFSWNAPPKVPKSVIYNATMATQIRCDATNVTQNGNVATCCDRRVFERLWAAQKKFVATILTQNGCNVIRWLCATEENLGDFAQPKKYIAALAMLRLCENQAFCWSMKFRSQKINLCRGICPCETAPIN